MARRQIRGRHVANCIFCDGKANSREHAWSDWMIRRFRRSTNVIFGEIEGETASGFQQKEIRIRCVCTDCNTGWMKGQEDAVIPTAGAMMQDIAVRLDVQQQHAIAAWAVTKAMVWEYLSDPNRPIFYQPCERSALRTTGAIPINTSVWLARYSGRANLYVNGGDIVNPATDGHPPMRGHVTSIVGGRLALQVLTLGAGPGLRGSVESKPGPWRSTTVKIWPTTSLTAWPPQESVGSVVSIDDFCHRWHLAPGEYVYL